MCGIAGKIYFNSNAVKLYHLKNMAALLKHRGPDNTGYYLSQDKKIGLAHTRLAIVDLSSKGNQPMNYKNRYTITFNGEIYNFKEEKEKLTKLGYHFNSNTDTEVILALYDKYKVNCLKHLRGMFAFAIYDEATNEVFIARDRIGKKPFKYYINSNCFIFASEIKSILSQNEVSTDIDYLAIQKYFLYGYVPSPLTGFKNIFKLEPGHYMLINIKTGNIIKRKYWEPSFSEKLDLSESEWSNQILNLLEESTKLRMIADVPIGAFLSGGVDSSAIVALMALNSNKPINTFTITYENKKWSESKYANIIASKYKTNHTEILVKPHDFNELENLVCSYDEPFSDNSALVSLIVSREAKKHVSVVLNGDGGDELFAGYPNRYYRLKRDVDYDFWLQKIRPNALKTINLLQSIHRNSNLTKINNFIKKTELPLYERFVSYSEVFSYQEIMHFSCGELIKLMHYDNLYAYARRCFDNFKGKDLKDAGLKFDLLYFLPDMLLTKMDIATSSYALEARSPILDYKLIELSCKIPFELKVKNGETKYIFKKALEKIVPSENLYRPKMGFTISLADWFKGGLEKYYKSKINKHSHISMLVDLSQINQTDERKKWSLLMLELWLRNYF